MTTKSNKDDSIEMDDKSIHQPTKNAINFSTFKSSAFDHNLKTDDSVVVYRSIDPESPPPAKNKKISSSPGFKKPLRDTMTSFKHLNELQKRGLDIEQLCELTARCLEFIESNS